MMIDRNSFSEPEYFRFTRRHRESFYFNSSETSLSGHSGVTLRVRITLKEEREL